MTAPAAARTTFLDRFLALLPLLLVLLALLSLLFWEAAIRKTPTIFGDELEWTQISRSIAATGHAARRGEPISFKSLYAFLIAPLWWIHSTGAAYAAIKYVNTVVMALAAIPTYLIARTMVARSDALVAALAALCTSALYYAGFILPEVLAYPTFVLGAWVSIRALSGGGRRWIAGAIVLDLVATQVRGELLVLPASFALAAIVLWLAGPRGQRLRGGWGRYDYLGATLLALGALIVLNELVSAHAQQWATVTRLWMGRFWSLGFNAASAFSIGLGLLPVVGGLASLWLPGRRRDPVWRAFAAFTSASIVTVWTYTAVKAAFLSTNFATRVEERNLIYLGPLMIVGTVVWLRTRRRWLPGTLGAWAFVTWLVLYYGYQLDYPYFEAPGYGIAVLANRSWHWDQPAIRTALLVASLVLLAALLLMHAPRVPPRANRILLLVVAAVTLTWMLAGEITSSRGSAAASNAYAAHLPKPFDWIDRATNGAAVTFLGENISTGQALGVNLLEFWNRSVHHIWSLDGTGPPPGPTLTPDLQSRTGVLSHDPGLRYVVATTRVNLIGPLVASRPGLTLREIAHHPWRLHDAEYGVSDDGWISGSSDHRVADGTYAYFGPETRVGTVHIDVSRAGFCATGAPSTHITVRVGPLALNEQRAPEVAHATFVKRFVLHNCTTVPLTVRIAPPLAVEVHADPTVRPSDYGISESRELGAQVGFGFTPR